MIDINNIGPGSVGLPQDIEFERKKEIKSRAGKIAFLTAMGQNSHVSEITPGIGKAEGALKWMEKVFKEDKWE